MKPFTRLLAALCGIIILTFATNAQERYWVGGTGDWNDPGHWTYTSGGAGGASVPTEKNDVYIDEFSFDEDYQYINVTSPIYSNNFNWTNSISTAKLVASESPIFTISGSIKIAGDALLDYFGNIVLSSNKKSNTINISGVSSAKIIIDSRSGEFSLSNDLYIISDLIFKQGDFNSENKTITCQNLIIDKSNLHKIDLKKSLIYYQTLDIQNQKIVIGKPEFVQDKAAFSISCSSTNETCYGKCDGTITVNLTAGAPVYPVIIYLSRPAACGGGITSYSTISFPYVISNVCACQIQYSVRARDNNGAGTWSNWCVPAPSVVGPEEPKIQDTTITNPLCGGICDGEISVDAVNAMYDPKQFIWSTGSTDSLATNLCVGVDYTVTITDIYTCTLVHTFVQLTSPGELIVSKDSTMVLCKGDCNGGATLTPSGGTSPYTCLWWDGGTDLSRSDLCAGTFSFTVSDVNSCQKIDSVQITEPALALTITLDLQNNITCPGGNDGAIFITVTGGTPTYSYLWSNAASTQDITNLLADTYTVTVTDNNNCTATATYTITEPPPITLTETITNVSCNGLCDGAISIVVNGGTPSYNFSWSGPSFASTLEDILGLCAGDYTVTVKDVQNCEETFGPFTVTEPPSMTITAVITNVLCFGGSTGAIDITVNGGTPAYTYDWSNDGPESPDNDLEDLSGVGAGSYTLTVTDANGCQTTNGPHNVTQPASALSVTLVSITNVTCFGASTGAVDVTVSGGTPVYTYLWSNGATTVDLTNVAAGSYTLTVTDANGCQTTSGP
ncbi:MAG: SprB repeat-containing protein, partial [Bacteroidia bacterium]|nr:SprB repeat-containing protein [Bacteroidia bacterium]